MCGITGLWDTTKRYSPEQLQALSTQMTDMVVHRGPDSGAVFVDAAAHLALGHRRLAILDLSPAGYQPMTSACGGYVLVFNGEVYNSAALRADLSHIQIAWRGHSDTETILESLVHLGIEATLPKMIGMFALALWDKRRQCLTLIRDRFGVKPLHWSWKGGQFAFASELKSLIDLPHMSRHVRRDAQYDFLHTGYIHGTKTIWQDIYKLAPGHMLTFSSKNKEPVITCYYDLRDVWAQGQANPTQESEAELQDRLHALLLDAVKQRMVADVPLGTFLSGGIDSSLVTALMQAQSLRPVKTFTIGFEDQRYNEAPFARDVAQHLGTDHHELIVTEREALNVIPRLPIMFDEPFADSSQIPTFLVSQLARTQVTVSLSGDGGDEFFGGYSRYTDGLRLHRLLQSVPSPLRHLGHAILTRMPSPWLNRLGNVIPYKPMQNYKLAERIQKLNAVLQDMTIDAFYGQLIAHQAQPNDLLQDPVQHAHFWQHDDFLPPVTDKLTRMQLYDALIYLPDDILTKVDRASMAVSLESREPLLDHRLIAFASHLPQAMKIRNGQGKYLLRQVLYRYVPAHLIDRPKMGFGIPLGSWLRGPLREWAEALLDAQTLTQNGFHAAPIRQKWQQHVMGQANWDYILWDILCYQSWAQLWLSGAKTDVIAAA